MHRRRHGCWWCGSYVFVVLQEMINIIGTTVQRRGLHQSFKLPHSAPVDASPRSVIVNEFCALRDVQLQEHFHTDALCEL